MVKVNLDNFYISEDLYQCILEYKNFLMVENPDSSIIKNATFDMFLSDYLFKFCPREVFKID